MDSASYRNQIPQYTLVWMCTIATWSSSRPKNAKKKTYRPVAKGFLGCTLSKFRMMSRSSHVPLQPTLNLSLVSVIAPSWMRCTNWMFHDVSVGADHHQWSIEVSILSFTKQPSINAIQSTMNYESYFIGILKQSYLLPLVLSCFYSHRSTCHVVLPRDGGDDFFVKIPHDTSQITWRDRRDWHAPETEVLYCHIMLSKKSEVEHVEHWTWNSRFGKKEWLIDWFISCHWS